MKKKFFFPLDYLKIYIFIFWKTITNVNNLVILMDNIYQRDFTPLNNLNVYELIKKKTLLKYLPKYSQIHDKI